MSTRVAAPSAAAQIACQIRPYDHPDAVALVRALYADQVSRYGYADPAGADPDAYAPPGGLFLIAYCAAVPVGCGGYRTHDDAGRIAEIKKMYVLPDLRGRDIGKLILTRLEAHAAGAGFTVMILETGIRNTAAIGLYTAMGYRPRARYAAGYRDPAVNRAFSKPLTSPGPTPPAAPLPVPR